MKPAELSEKISRKQSFLLSNDGQFLGKITFNKYDADSIVNQYGSYGSKYSATSIFNQYSSYGSQYSSLSPYNRYTSTPPKIYLRGELWGFLTKNKYLGPKTVEPEALQEWMQINRIGMYD
ncbi:hypothetical protein DNI29_19575 [Hymenobacter sediminis]|uniref:hypothetical protein n=1 Tax=Hymenobacter sediminis TaxID=2218621 RepID=UPI000DA6D1AF|nr:hypothetical protein [Hymenobacter sediminis]RPD44903.1 hypothetical protein DNI29_19575 [Hymenobacter sediminis]